MTGVSKIRELYCYTKRNYITVLLHKIRSLLCHFLKNWQKMLDPLHSDYHFYRASSKIGPKLLLMTNRKSHTPFRLVPKSMTLNGQTHYIAEKMRLSEPTTKIWMKIDPYCQQQKCRPMALVSGGIRFVRILILWRFPTDGASNDSAVVDNGNFQHFCWLFFRIL